VETYIINSKHIKNECSIDSTEYSDLISIEKTLNKLYIAGTILTVEYNVVHLMAQGMKFKDIEALTNLSQYTISKSFISACNKIAYFLGDHFTDEGYMIYMKSAYGLRDEEIAILATYISGHLRHKLARKVRKLYARNSTS